MAGIGFRLQKLLRGDDYTSAVKAFAFSTLITAGPFLLTVLLVLFVQTISVESLTDRGIAYLQSLITYAYALSLVTVGPSYLVLTRYVADEYYRGHVTSFSASFFSAYTWNLAFWGLPVFWFFSGLSAGWEVKLAAMMLYALAVGMWLAMIFLSAAQNYWLVSRAFLLGLLVSLPAAYVLGYFHGMPGYFAGFIIGQAVVLATLIGAMLEEFGYWEARDDNWLSYFRLYPRLAGIGFFYNVGIWADKFLFWASREGEWLDPRLRYAPIYDTPMFVAYMTILPSLVYFFLLVETDFFLKYHDYFESVSKQEGLRVLEKNRRAIVSSLRFSLRRVLTVQGLVTVLSLALAPWIITLARLDPMHLSVLRLGIYSAFIQAGTVIALNILLYFDHQKEGLMVAGVFCLLNAVFTELSLRLGLLAYGYGYGLACLVSLAMALYYLNERLRLLHFWTFTRQPFPSPVAQDEDPDEEYA
jgi:polysaccharide biosynthesis protein PelG